MDPWHFRKDPDPQHCLLLVFQIRICRIRKLWSHPWSGSLKYLICLHMCNSFYFFRLQPGASLVKRPSVFSIWFWSVRRAMRKAEFLWPNLLLLNSRFRMILKSNRRMLKFCRRSKLRRLREKPSRVLWWRNSRSELLTCHLTSFSYWCNSNRQCSGNTQMRNCSNRLLPVCLSLASIPRPRIWIRRAVASFPALESHPPYPLEVPAGQVPLAWAAGLFLKALFIADKIVRTLQQSNSLHRLLQGGNSTGFLLHHPLRSALVFGCSHLPSQPHHLDSLL